MAETFDPYDESSWYFGNIDRNDANDLISQEIELGVFLVRDSSTNPGDFVLCVKENNKICNFIINKIESNNGLPFYRIGEHRCKSLPELLQFYQVHYIETTALKHPVNKHSERVKALYDFESRDRHDLSFEAGDFLFVVKREKNSPWLTARNMRGDVGFIPVDYVETFSMNFTPAVKMRKVSHIMSDYEELPRLKHKSLVEGPIFSGRAPKLFNGKILPAYAIVIQDRIPNAYEKNALKMTVGNRVKVLKMNIGGIWMGELNGKIGTFPFTYVKFESNEFLFRNKTY